MSVGRERREEERLEVLLPVDYYLDQGRAFKFHVAGNISSGGAFISTSNPVKVGEELDAILSFFDEDEPDLPPRRIAVHGQVRHFHSPKEGGDGTFAGMGVQWVDLDTRTWREMQHMARKQVERTFKGPASQSPLLNP